jgi:hypothetical protein
MDRGESLGRMVLSAAAASRDESEQEHANHASQDRRDDDCGQHRNVQQKCSDTSHKQQTKRAQ